MTLTQQIIEQHGSFDSFLAVHGCRSAEDVAVMQHRMSSLVRLCCDAIDLAGDADHLSLRKLTERKQNLKRRLAVLS